jgi:hypothetical protein
MMEIALTAAILAAGGIGAWYWISGRQGEPAPPEPKPEQILQTPASSFANPFKNKGQSGKVFGRPLSEFDAVPSIILQCLAALDKKGKISSHFIH